jgi:hypothetical protein
MIGLRAFGGAGKIIALSSCLAYAVVFVSVPTLLRTKLLIGPAGAAVALGSARVVARPGS